MKAWMPKNGHPEHKKTTQMSGFFIIIITIELAARQFKSKADARS
jgi:hypothetical protein